MYSHRIKVGEPVLSSSYLGFTRTAHNYNTNDYAVFIHTNLYSDDAKHPLEYCLSVLTDEPVCYSVRKVFKVEDDYLFAGSWFGVRKMSIMREPDGEWVVSCQDDFLWRNDSRFFKKSRGMLTSWFCSSVIKSLNAGLRIGKFNDIKQEVLDAYHAMRKPCSCDERAKKLIGCMKDPIYVEVETLRRKLIKDVYSIAENINYFNVGFPEDKLLEEKLSWSLNNLIASYKNDDFDKTLDDIIAEFGIVVIKERCF